MAYEFLEVVMYDALDPIETFLCIEMRHSASQLYSKAESKLQQSTL